MYGKKLINTNFLYNKNRKIALFILQSADKLLNLHVACRVSMFSCECLPAYDVDDLFNLKL